MKRVITFFSLLTALFLLGGCKFSFGTAGKYELKSPSSYAELEKLVEKRNTGFGGGLPGEFTIAPNSPLYKNDDAVKTESRNDYTTTNIQVDGVDEADRIKNDGRYIYIAQGDAFTIIDTADNSAYTYSDENFVPNQLYLYENRLIVIGSNTIVYSSNFTVRIYDITDVSELKLTREVILQDGWYVSSRMIDGDIYFILTTSCYDYINEKAIVPRYKDSAVDNEFHELKLDEIKICNGFNYYSHYNILLSFNVLEEIKANITAYLGILGRIYSSKDNMYIANTMSRMQEIGIKDSVLGVSPFYNIETVIYRFAITDGKYEYKAQSVIPGYVYNQFAMDEYDGYLRVITTTGNESFAYVLSLANNLKTVSSIGGIGVGESVYSVRFEGERGYVVTFKQIDPLYIIDFSNPKKLVILSELKSPGVSDYLHKYNENLLIGIGRDIEDNIAKGIKISLFDITDETNPVEVDIYHLNNIGYSATELQYNHKVLLDYRKLNILAFPVYGIYDNRYQGGMYVFHINEAENKVTLKGIVTATDNGNYYKGIKRGVIINDCLYSISDYYVYVNDLNNDLNEVKVIHLQ